MTAASTSSSFPARQVRYVVPFRPAGPPDAVARVLAPELERRWGQVVAVDNRAGANGNLGCEFVARSPADGHTLLQGSSATHGSNSALFPRMLVDPRTDTLPVTSLIEGALFLGVPRDLPFDGVQDLLARARSKPGTLRYATAGPGSPHHLAGELLRSRAGIDITPVHYEGAARALEALLAAEVELYFGSDFAIHPGFDRVRLLAVSTRWRWPLASHVPTLIESGVPGFEIHGWFGLFAPAGTAPALVERINADVNAILALAPVRDRLQQLGYRVLGGTPAELGARVDREILYWSELVRQSNLRLV